MAKTIKKEAEKKPGMAKVLMRRLRGMMQLCHFESEKRFVVIVQTSPKQRFFVEWDKLAEVYEDMKATVDAKRTFDKAKK